MATAISRKLNLTRYIYRSLYQQRSTNPSFHLFHGAPHRPVPLPQSNIFLGQNGVQSLAILHRHLCGSTATSNTGNEASSSVTSNTGNEASSSVTSNTGNEVNSDSKSNGDGHSGTGDQSGDSQRSSQQEQGKAVRGGPVSWLSFLLLIITGAGLIFYYDNEKKRHIQGISNASNAVKQGPSVGQAAIGGPFSLVNHDGKSVTEKDFFGKWTVIYFGFTHCPDICPDELQKLATAVDNIKKKAGIEIVPVFISVDPERDNVEQVREYVKEFHPNLIGLTGSPDEVKKAARAYRVYYMKTEEEDSDYLVDHSIIMYLMDPNMQFVKFYGKNNDVDALTNGIIKEIKQYKKV